MNFFRRLGELKAVTDDDVVAVAGIFKQRGFALRHLRIFADRDGDVGVFFLRRLDAFGGCGIESAVADRARQNERDLQRPMRVSLRERRGNRKCGKCKAGDQ